MMSLSTDMVITINMDTTLRESLSHHQFMSMLNTITKQCLISQVDILSSSMLLGKRKKRRLKTSKISKSSTCLSPKQQTHLQRISLHKFRILRRKLNKRLTLRFNRLMLSQMLNRLPPLQ